MSTEKTDEERRRFKRIPKEVPVEILFLRYPMTDEPERTAASKDISGGGICFSASKDYKPKTWLYLKLPLAGWQPDKRAQELFSAGSAETPLLVVAEVVWCRKCRDRDGYDVGVKFVGMYEEDTKALLDFLYR